MMLAHARKVRLIGESGRKDDWLEGQTLGRLARLARIDPQLLCPAASQRESAGGLNRF